MLSHPLLPAGGMSTLEGLMQLVLGVAKGGGQGAMPGAAAGAACGAARALMTAAAGMQWTGLHVFTPQILQVGGWESYGRAFC